MDQVLDALAGTQGEMVFFPERQHAGDCLAAVLPLFIGKSVPHTTGERRFEQLLPREVRAEPSSQPV